MGCLTLATLPVLLGVFAPALGAGEGGIDGGLGSVSLGEGLGAGELPVTAIFYC